MNPLDDPRIPVFQANDVIRKLSTNTEYEIVNRFKMNYNWLFLLKTENGKEDWVKETDFFSDISDFVLVSVIVKVKF